MKTIIKELEREANDLANLIGMKKYQLYIPSHCEAPDYQDEVWAINKEDASVKFYLRMNENKDDFYPHSIIQFVN